MEKRTSPILLFGALLVQGLISGVIVGGLTGLLEIAALLLSAGDTALNFLIPAVVFYAALWSFIAVTWGILLFGMSLWGLRLVPGEPLTRWYLALLIPLSLFMVVGGHINIAFLPSFADPRSLIFDGIFLILNFGLGYWLYRDGVGRIRRLIARCPWWIGLTLLVAALALGLAITIFAVQSKRENEIKSEINRPPTPPSAPNVLLITLDALRADHLSVYGYSRPTSPNLDQFAKEGVVFNRAFANSSWTKASVTTMFTSLYPSSHKANEMGAGVPHSLLTLPEIMRSHGYTTAVFSGNSFVSPLFGFGQGVDHFYHKEVSIFKELMPGYILMSLRKCSPYISRAYRALRDLQLGPRKATDAAGLSEAFINWVKTLNGKPFFAYVHYLEPHEPYAPPSPFNALYDPDYPPPYMSRAPLSEGFEPFDRAQSLPPRPFTNLTAQYDGGITYADHEAGGVFQKLKELGLYDRTIIIVTSDHGEEFYEHGGWGHGNSLFNVLLHVPLLMRYPPALPAGTKTEAVAQHIDLVPTILDLCGFPASGLLEGRSVVPRAKGLGAIPDSSPVYSEVFHGKSYARAVRDGQFKLIEAHSHEKEAWLLFDLANDPGEQSPLDVNAHPIGSRLKEELSSFRKKAGEKAVQSEAVKIDQDTKENLKALGYLQ